MDDVVRILNTSVQNAVVAAVNDNVVPSFEKLSNLNITGCQENQKT